MRHWKRYLSLILPTLIISGCSSPSLTTQPPSKDEIKQEQSIQLEKAFRYQLQQQTRLAEVARPLLTKNIEACGKRTKPSLGIFIHSLDDYKKPKKAVAKSIYSLNEQPSVLQVLSNGPAHQKLKVGDKLVSINQQPFPKGTAKSIKHLSSNLKDQTAVELTVERDEDLITLSIQPELLCDYPVILSPSDAINGYADGSTIVITQGLMRFAQDDNELALIIAHEMAHNTQHHIPQRIKNSSLGLLLDTALLTSGIPSPLIATGLGANLYTQQYEIEADLIGLQLMHNAGFEIEGLDLFWQKMAAVHPSTITKGKEISHPTTVERSIQIRKEITRLKNLTSSVNQTSATTLH